VTLAVPAGPSSVTQVRDALGELVADGDPVVLEQVAVLVGALTSGADRPGAAASAPFELELRAEPSRVVVQLFDADFTAHRSEGGLVELERSMVSAWRLKLVERLADRWSITYDDVFILRFEFDVERGMTLRAEAEGPLEPAPSPDRTTVAIRSDGGCTLRSADGSLAAKAFDRRMAAGRRGGDNRRRVGRDRPPMCQYQHQFSAST